MSYLALTGLEFRGMYKLYVFRGAAVTQETPWFDNLITDRGLDLLAYGISRRCWVGSGNTPPSPSDIALEASHGVYASRIDTSRYSAVLTDPQPYSREVSTFRFGIGQIGGTVSEVGIGGSDSDLFSRALLPEPLDLDGEVDRLYVIYELRQCIPIGSQFFATIIDGRLRYCEAYPAVPGGSYWRCGLQHGIWQPGSNHYFGKQLDFWLEDGTYYRYRESPTAKGVEAPYVLGSYIWRVMNSRFGPGVTGNIVKMRVGFGDAGSGFHYSNGGIWDILISPPIAIEDHQRFVFDCGVSWDRCDATAQPEDPVDPSYPALFYDIEIVEGMGRFEVVTKSTDTGNSYYPLLDLTSEEPTLLDYTAISAVNTHTASTGLAVESLGSTDYGHLVRFYADTLTDPFDGAVILGHSMRNCDDDAFTQYATMRDLRSGGGQFFAPRCTPTLNRTDFFAEFYVRRTTYTRFAITSSDTSDTEVEVYQHSAAESFLPSGLIDAINAETANTGIVAELVRELRGGFIVRVLASPGAFPFDATLAYECDEYDWAARTWSRTSDGSALSTPVQVFAESAQLIDLPGYRVFIFASTADIRFDFGYEVDVLLVGGGGGGGGGGGAGQGGGGGGAGGFREFTGVSVSPGIYSITVGAGGTGGASSTSWGGGGGDSSAFNLVANGGAGGAYRRGWSSDPGGRAGASGSGGARGNAGGLGNDPATDPAQGCHGYRAGGGQGGGGGGAGSCAFESNGFVHPHGGDGRSSSITGTETYYAGGGAGGRDTTNKEAINEGGLGGGGSDDSTGPAQHAIDGTGGGGGGGGPTRNAGGDGGSGVVIIRVPV